MAKCLWTQSLGTIPPELFSEKNGLIISTLIEKVFDTGVLVIVPDLPERPMQKELMHWLNQDISDFKIRIIDGEWSKLDHGVEEKDSEIPTAGEIEIPLLRSTYFPASNSAETTPLLFPSPSNAMSVRAPLVQGGHIRDPLRVPEAFISRTLPEVYNNTIVVAATHAALNSTHATSDGWFLSDFYAFNYLLKGMGHPGDKDRNVPGQVLNAYQIPSSGYG